MALPILLLACPSILPAQTAGYGYGRGKDPFVLSLKSIVLEVRREHWDDAVEETRKLHWLFEELDRDLDVQLEEPLVDALRGRSLARVSREVSTLVYFALVQKFEWNRREKLEIFTRARSRVEAAREYYEEILAIGVARSDRQRETTHHRDLLASFSRMETSVGSPGLFGFNARPPDPETFHREETAVRERLLDVFSHIKAVESAREERRRKADAERARAQTADEKADEKSAEKTGDPDGSGDRSPDRARVDDDSRPGARHRERGDEPPRKGTGPDRDERSSGASGPGQSSTER